MNSGIKIKLGKGSYGVVYKREEWNGIRYVAIKEIPHIYLKKQSEVDSQNYYDHLKMLTHKNLVEMYDFYDLSNQIGIVMGYMEGESLKSRLHREGELIWSERRNIAKDVMCGLDYLHSKGVVHGDLRSANVFIENGVAKLSDFGISLTLEAIQSEWAAPEILSGKSLSTMKSDIYSLGVLFWELVLRQYPSKDQTLPENCPSDFKTIIENAIVEHPDHRQDLSAFRMVLQASIQNVREIELIDSRDVQKGEVIGQGQFGGVYKATWKGQQIAVKTFRATTQSKKEVLREIGVMLQLRHPNIIELYGFYVQPEYGLIMEYMQGKSLWDLLHSDEKISWGQKRLFAIDMACGLEYLHSKEVLHRDIKSLNVLLTSNLIAKLADFGLAKLNTSTQSTASANQCKGTIRWMAPENFVKGNADSPLGATNALILGIKSDIYSLGITFFELASREVPFKNVDNDFALPYLLGEGVVCEVPDDCPEDFSSIITDCTNVNPDKRLEMFSIQNRLNLWYEPLVKELFFSKEGFKSIDLDMPLKSVVAVRPLVEVQSTTPEKSPVPDTPSSSPLRSVQDKWDIRQFIWTQSLIVGVSAIIYLRYDIVYVVSNYYFHLGALFTLFGSLIFLILIENDSIIDPKGLVKMSMWNSLPREEQLEKAIVLKKGLIYIRNVIDKGDFLDALIQTTRGVITHDLFPCEGKAVDGSTVRAPYIADWNLCVSEQSYNEARWTATWPYQLGLFRVQTTILALNTKSHFDGLDETTFKELQSLAPMHLNPLSNIDKVLEFFRLHPEVSLRVEEWKERIFQFLDYYISTIDLNIKKFQDAKDSRTNSSFGEMLVRGFRRLMYRWYKILKSKRII